MTTTNDGLLSRYMIRQEHISVIYLQRAVESEVVDRIMPVLHTTDHIKTVAAPQGSAS